MEGDKIILIAGLFGMKSSPLRHYLPAVNQLACEIGASVETFDWDTPLGFSPYVGIKRLYAICHSWGVNRFYLDCLRLRGNVELELHAAGIDGVRFTNDDDPDDYEGSWTAQQERQPFDLPENVLTCSYWHRQIPEDYTIFDMPISSRIVTDPSRPGITCTELPGFGHNNVVPYLQNDVIAACRSVMQ